MKKLQIAAALLACALSTSALYAEENKVGTTDPADKTVTDKSPSKDEGLTVSAAKGSESETLAILIAVDTHEMAAAKAAKEKKISQPVLNYAKMMFDAHSEHKDKTVAVGKTIGVTPADTDDVGKLKVKFTKELSDLSLLDGAAFEEAYVDSMVKGHQEVIDMIEKKLKATTKNPDLTALLAKTQAAVQHHLEGAKALKENLK